MLIDHHSQGAEDRGQAIGVFLMVGSQLGRISLQHLALVTDLPGSGGHGSFKKGKLVVVL